MASTDHHVSVDGHYTWTYIAINTTKTQYRERCVAWCSTDVALEIEIRCSQVRQSQSASTPSVYPGEGGRACSSHDSERVGMSPSTSAISYGPTDLSCLVAEVISDRKKIGGPSSVASWWSPLLAIVIFLQVCRAVLRWRCTGIAPPATPPGSILPLPRTITRTCGCVRVVIAHFTILLAQDQEM